jgi:phosphinothricin acetyltransferase
VTISIQPAKPFHIPAILDIYNHAVIHTTASYDYQPSTLEQRTEWYDKHQQAGLPVLVALNTENTVVGWGR